MSNTYISSDTIRFDKDFIFTFDVIGEIHRDFEIEFKVGEEITNEFLISNNLNTNYTLKSGITPSFSAVKKTVSDINSEISFFDDELIIHEGKVYKNFNKENRDDITGFYRKNDKLYIESDLYSLDGNYITRKNPKLEENIYLRPVVVKKTFKKGQTKTSLSSYFDDTNNPVNSNITKTYRIIVSDNACLISFLVKEKDSFKVIKNFTYPTTQEISEGKISLKVDKNMELSNLHFSFFKA